MAAKRTSEIVEASLMAAGCSAAPAPITSCACAADTLPKNRTAPANSLFISFPSAGFSHAGNEPRKYGKQDQGHLSMPFRTESAKSIGGGGEDETSQRAVRPPRRP